MASAFARGSGEGRRFFARFKDERGQWRARRVRVTTRAAALRIARQLEEQAELRRYGLAPPASSEERVGPLLQRWADGLANRSAADDRSRVRLHVAPRWGGARLRDLTLAAIMLWLDDLRGSALAPATQRHLLNIVSRFLSWCVERGLATTNPCRDVPPGKRPRGARRRDVPWLADDETARRLFGALPAPVNLMFAVGLTSGARLMEIAGLRLSDLDALAAGTIRVRRSGSGALKEDRRGDGRAKWVPASADVAELLLAWLERRRAQGAGPEDLVFPRPDGGMFLKHDVRYRWRRACAAVGVSLSWHQGTRHSFVSRALARGAALDEVSQACGHATPAITAEVYGHFVRRSWSPLVAAGVGFVRALGPIEPDPAPDGAVPRLSSPAAARNTPGMEIEQGGDHAPA